MNDWFFTSLSKYFRFIFIGMACMLSAYAQALSIPDDYTPSEIVQIQGWAGEAATGAWGTGPVCIWSNEENYGWVYSCSANPNSYGGPQPYSNRLTTTVEESGQIRIWTSDRRKCLKADTQSEEAYPYATWTSACSGGDSLFQYTEDHQLVHDTDTSPTGKRFLVFGYSTLYYGVAYGALGLVDHADVDDLYSKWKIFPTGTPYGDQ